MKLFNILFNDKKINKAITKLEKFTINFSAFYACEVDYLIIKINDNIVVS